jgi:23S rRNA pseudouridine1911/1915/1917 synthase
MLTGCSRAEAAELVGAGSVRVGGAPATTRSARVAPGDVVEIERAAEVGRGDPAADPSVPLTVVYEDPDLVVLDKPAGVVVHPGAGWNEGTLVHGLLARYPELAGVGQPGRPGIVHRLDKGTSGLLLVARSPRAYEALVEALAARRVRRCYRALVWGQPGAPAGLIDAPVGRSARTPTRMAVTERGREARTRYEVLARYHEPAELAELACRLDTGRTHQIRVHLASIGHPVVGDARYGGARPAVSLERPFLHAESLGLDHPVSGEHLELSAPLPDDLAAVLARCA